MNSADMSSLLEGVQILIWIGDSILFLLSVAIGYVLARGR